MGFDVIYLVIAAMIIIPSIALGAIVVTTVIGVIKTITAMETHRITIKREDGKV